MLHSESLSQRTKEKVWLFVLTLLAKKIPVRKLFYGMLCSLPVEGGPLPYESFRLISFLTIVIFPCVS